MSFTVYRSSAGSGKTFTLVKEYLKIILPRPSDFRHILAITFTNKVANEMKERILHNLEELAKPDALRDTRITHDLLPMLVMETGLEEDKIRKKAAEALALILHNYSDFSVSTIDSFSHRIIRTFAHDFGLPLNFTVEMDADELLQTAVDLLLDRVGEEASLTGLLVHFLESMMDDEKGWRIGEILLEFSRALNDEEGKIHLEKLRAVSLADFDRIAGSLFAKRNAFESGIKKIAAEACRLIEEKGIPDSAFTQGKNGIGSWFRKLRDGNFLRLVPSDTLQKIIAEGKWHSQKASADEKKMIDSIKGRLEAYYRNIEELRTKDLKLYTTYTLLAKTIYPLAVLNEIDRMLEAFKKQNNLVHISEFNRRIAAIIMNEPVPFLYERLGDWYHHLLIDEFQDTSVLQWNNLLPLIDNSLASGYFNLVVGDGKQAIYRWRNGDVGQFAMLPSLYGSQHSALIREREASLRNHYKEESLTRNFRSKAEIVDFNNRFFTSISSMLPEDSRKIYGEVEQEYKRDIKGGYIRIEFSKGNEENGDGYDEVTLQRIIAIIQELTARNYKLKDITILCRSNDSASLVARHLMLNGIPVISAESLLLTFSPEVNFITDFIRLFDEPSNPMPKASLVTFLYRTERIKGRSFHDCIRWIADDRPSPDGFISFLRNNSYDHPFSKILLLPVFDLCEELVRIFHLNREADPYLQFFLDAVMAYSRKISSGIAGFLSWWELNSKNRSVIIPRGLDAVQVMTIHKAKGLQFPVVIYPFAHQKMRYGKRYLWVDLPEGLQPGLKAAMLKPEKKIAETDFAEVLAEEESKSALDLVNILYVAMTRPEERLYLLTEFPPKKSESITVSGLVKYFLESTGQWEDGRVAYEFGTDSPHEQESREPVAASEKLETFISNPWQEKLILRWKAPELWDVEDPSKNRKWGNLVHSALSKIRHVTDLDGVLEEVTAAGWIAEDKKEDLKDILNKILHNKEVRLFFEDKLQVRNEAEILLKDGTVYRPDRVIISGDTVTVMDYKTGKKDEKYRTQLLNYEKLLLEMGYREVNKYLLYLEPEIELINIDH